MEMNNNLNFPRLALVVITGISALNAQAGEVSNKQPLMSVAEHCLQAVGMQEVQPIREMAKEMSPDVILDKVFSSVAPDYQKALLSKPSVRGKPAEQLEAMRDPKLVLPAIATMQVPFNWFRVRADGRVIEPASDAAKPDPNWARAAEEQPKKSLVLPAPQRY